MEDRYNAHEEDFVDDVEEESLEEDVQRQIDQTIAAYNSKKDKEVHFQRPESANKPVVNSKSRIDSAKPAYATKKESAGSVESPANNYEPDRRKEYMTLFYERLNEYVRQHQISPDDFWSPNKDKLNADEFKECLDIIGFAYGREEFEDVIFDVTDTDFNVSLPALCSKIKSWGNYSAERTLEGLKDSVLKMAQDSKKKLANSESSKKNLMIRPQSGVLYTPGSGLFGGNARPFSGISQISTKSKGTLGSATNEYNNKMLSTDNTIKRGNYENRSAQYLKDAKKKEAKKDQILSLTLNKAKNEHDYDCLVKMGEANEISQGLGETITYRAYNAADGHLKCHVYDYDQLVAELTTKEFIREYKALKQRSNQKNNLKIWDQLSNQKNSGNNFYFSSAKSNSAGMPVKDENENGEKKGGGKKGKQEELKTVLFETMKLTNTLKSQLEKLERSGLVYESQPPKY